jgi:hypothetical protein
MAASAEEQLRLLVRGAAPSAPFGCYLFSAEDPAAEIARALERELFLSAFGNTEAQLELEYGPYEEASLFFVVVDHLRMRAAGMMRLIRPDAGGAGLKSLVDLGRYWGEAADASRVPPADGRTWDIATLAVAPEYQNPLGEGIVAQGLYQGVVRSCLEAKVEHLVAVLDLVVYRMTRIFYAEPFIALGPARPYLGSAASLPVYCTLAEWEERLQIADPVIHEVIYLGRGREASRPRGRARAARPHPPRRAAHPERRGACRELRPTGPLSRLARSADEGGRLGGDALMRAGEHDHQVGELVGAHRPGVEVALDTVASETAEPRRLLDDLHALRDGADPQRLGHRDDRRDEAL